MKSVCLVKRNYLQIFTSLFCLVALTSCMTSEREEALNKSINDLSIKIRDVENSIFTRDRSIDTIKNTADDSLKNAQNTKNDIEELRRQLALTQGLIDELRVKLTRTQEATSQGIPSSQQLVARVSELENNVLMQEKDLVKLSLYINFMLEERKSAPVPLKFKTSQELEKALSNAFSQKEYKKVITISNQVISADPGAKMADLAFLFRAEANFHAKKYDLAATDYLRLIEDHPASKHKPRALLMLGDSLVYLKKNTVAKFYYQDCVTNFADKEECKAAKERLEKMNPPRLEN